MKKKIVLSIVILTLLMSFTGCKGSNLGTYEGPFTNNNWNDFADNVSAKIDDDILQTCYRYADNLGYSINDKEKYQSVLLGKSSADSVAAIDDDTRSMIDENDYLIIFQEIRIVIDTDTGVVLGTIPYV